MVRGTAAEIRQLADELLGTKGIVAGGRSVRDGIGATVKFTQVYQDERLRRLDQKTMVWQKREGQWLIQSETTD